jgi:hypothetical protein
MRAVQAAHRYSARGGNQAAVDLAARSAAAAVVLAAGVHAVPPSRVALPVGRCRRDRQWADGIAARRAPMAVGADPLAVRGSCPAVDPGQGRAADPPLDPDGGLQVAMVVAAARAALSLRRGPTPPDPSVAASRRRGRSLQISPPAVERRECRPLSSINHRTRTRLAGLSALVHFPDAATPFRPPTSSRPRELPWCYSFLSRPGGGLRSRPTRSVSESRCAR